MASQQQGSLDFGPDFGEKKSSSGGSVEELYGTGLELFGREKYQEAVQYFEKALQLDRTHWESLKYLGMAYFHLGIHDKAVEQFQKALDKEPESEDLLWYCGTAYLKLNRYAEAERCHRKIISLNPKSGRGHLGLGQILYRKGLYNEAIEILKKCGELEPDNPEILFLLGEAYNKLDKIDLAVSCFENILKKQQDNPKVYYNLGILYDKKGIPEEASLMYRRAKELSSLDSAAGRGIRKSISKDDLFFSRSLTVVDQVEQLVGKKSLDKTRYKKFKSRQLKKKPRRILPEEEKASQKIGTMDLTKASLKINEAIKILKDKKK